MVEIQIITRRHLFKIRLGGPFVTDTKPEKETVVSLSELERLELIRKLKEEYKTKNPSRADVAIEDMSIKKF